MTYPDLALIKKLIDRNIDERGTDECWPWTASKLSRYRQVQIHKVRYYAHRLAYLIATGIDPGELTLIHTCDNPGCCNPSHLRTSSQRESAADMHRSHRSAYCLANARTVYPWELVQAIRSAYAAGGQTMAQVGARFGISTSMVCNYINYTIRKYA